jgi:hypothetical protein
LGGEKSCIFIRKEKRGRKKGEKRKVSEMEVETEKKAK